MVQIRFCVDKQETEVEVFIICFGFLSKGLSHLLMKHYLLMKFMNVIIIKGKSVCSETRATSVRVKQTSEITSYSTYTFKKKKKYVLIKL